MKKHFRKIKAHKNHLFFFLIILSLGVLFFSFLLPLVSFARANSLNASLFYNLIFGQKMPLNNAQGRTNILILGMAGDHHPGADLTDTILFLSFDQEKKETFSISLPRDIWSESLRDKINSAYHYGRKKRKGGGLVLAAATAEEVLGQPVHYTFVIDFNGFEKIINLLGGIEIYVERSFDDYKFPLQGKEKDLCNGDREYKCRYEHLRFEKGWQKMDGVRALKFIRSRNAAGEEGTDFARNKRQQKLLEALKNKIFSLKTLTNPKLLIKLVNSLKENIQTDANLGETLYLGKLFFQEKERKEISLTEELTNPSPARYDGRWVLIPKQGWQSFHQFVKAKLLKGQ